MTEASLGRGSAVRAAAQPRPSRHPSARYANRRRNGRNGCAGTCRGGAGTV